jgi:methylated-DNA-protein-cysteine methyltransferase-like protein
MENEKPPLYPQIYAVVRTITHGTIASYSQVAAAIGMPRGARIVGWAMGGLPKDTDVPWWRVVNKAGQLSIRNPHFGSEEQRERLEREGVTLIREHELYLVTSDSWWTGLVVPPREQ